MQALSQKTLKVSILDEVMSITGNEAFKASKALAREEGFLVGISSGAALAAAQKLAERPENQDKNYRSPSSGCR